MPDHIFETRPPNYSVRIVTQAEACSNPFEFILPSKTQWDLDYEEALLELDEYLGLIRAV